MTKRKYVTIAILVWISLTGLLALSLIGCGPSEQDKAEAQAIVNESDHSIRLTDDALTPKAETKATAAARDQHTWETSIKVKSAFETAFYAVALGLAAIACGVILAVGTYGAWMGMKIALARYKENSRFVQVKVDKVTRTKPLLAMGNVLVDPNTGQVYDLTQAIGPHGQLVTVDGQVRALGVVGQSNVQIAKSIKDGLGPSDATATAAGNLPLIVAPTPEPNHDPVGPDIIRRIDDEYVEL